MSVGILQSRHREFRAWLALQIGLWLVGAGAGLGLAAALLDAAADLSEGERRLAPWLVGFGAVGVLGLGTWQARRWKEERLARALEGLGPAMGNRLTNAIQLSTHASKSHVEELLRLEAIELGRKAATQAKVWPIVRRGVRVAASVALLAAAAWLGMFLAASDLLQAVIPRFLDPSGDHPPYSKIAIDVAPGATEVLYGAQVKVKASVGSGNVAKLWLVAQSDTNVARTLMFMAPDHTFFQSLANLKTPTIYYVTDGRARSRRFPIKIRYTPQITLVEASMEFPAYTGRPTTTSRLNDDPQALPEDTRVGLRIVSNRPLASGQLTLTPVLGGKTQVVALQPQGDKSTVCGSFTLHEPVVFTLSVSDTDNLACADPRRGRFNVLPDERPRLFVQEPGRDAAATTSVQVPVRLEATDDYGVSRIVWLRGFNQSIQRPIEMKLTLKTGPQAVEATGSFDLAKLGVRPGDIIEYYFEAEDNYPKGPNVAISRAYKLQIISQTQYEAILRQAAARKTLFEPYFALDAWLGRLAERARSLAKKADRGSESDRQALMAEAASLQGDLAKYERELSKLFPQANLFDVEQAFRQTLAAQHTQVGRVRELLAGSFASGQTDLKKLSEAALELSRLAQADNEEVAQPARQIAAVARVLAQADTFVKLAQQQASVAQMLRRFADQTGGLSRAEQVEMQELAHQQRRVQEELRALLASLPELLAALPKDPQYAPLRTDVGNFVEAVAEASIEKDLEEGGRSLAALDGKSGYELARKVAEEMNRLVAKCSGGMQEKGESALRFKPSLQQALGNTLRQILAAMRGNGGAGQNGRDGYALFSDDVSLYGPNLEVAGEPGDGRGEAAQPATRGPGRISDPTQEAVSRQAASPGRVRLQRDAKFPLRYRDLVGEYFRVIAESQEESGRK